MRASSRTSSGGDTYAVIAALLSRPSQGDLLTPSGAESEPIGISVDAAEGEVVITVENRCVLFMFFVSNGYRCCRCFI